MTIGGWILFGFIALVILIGGLAIASNFDSGVAAIVTVIITIALILALLFGMRWYFNSTEAGKRKIKDQESNIKGGIERVVQVYDMQGDLIKEYSGEFDIEMHDTYILFDDENGQRHIVYFTTGIVVIDEK